MRHYFRFVNGFRKFQKARLEPEEAVNLAQTLISKRVAAREANFLNLVEKGIFQFSASPYRRILDLKKIQFSDLRTWVGRDGLEAALRILEAEGVYFTVDEFKGRVPVRRNGTSFRCHEKMFDNPFLPYVYEVQSGATRSAGTRIRIDFDYLHQRSLYDALLLDIHGCINAPVANWFPVFPGAPGINSSLRFAHIGNPVRRWFSQVDESNVKTGAKRKWGKNLLFALSRLYGRPLASAEYVDLNHAHKVAEWASQALQEHGQCVIYTFAASAVRVCIAAAELNLNIKGTKFLVTGEPLTPQKRKEIESTGASAIPVYGISEAGVIAAGCNRGFKESDHCHLYKDTTAIITHLYESPKLLLNVDMGDYGAIGTDACDCKFGQVGFDVHLSNIRSYEKLTGEGVTFVNTDFVWIIEKKLPEIFGGRSTDYQLVEHESQHGLPRLRLLVSPRIGKVDEAQVTKVFLELLKGAEDRMWADAGTEMWRQSGMVRIVRDNPIPTASGKILPFYSLKPGQHSGHGIRPVQGGCHGISNSKIEKTKTEWSISTTRS